MWPGGGLLEAFARFYGGELVPGARVPLQVLPGGALTAGPGVTGLPASTVGLAAS